MKEFKTFVPFPHYRYRIYVLFTDTLEGSADNLADQGLLAKSHGIEDDGTTGVLACVFLIKVVPLWF